MNKLIAIAILFLASLLPIVAAHDAVTVTIDQPTNNSLHLDNDVLLRAHMDDNGTLKYKLDSSSEVVVCNNCSSFQITLANLADGQHTVKVTGLAHENATDDATVIFNVNETEAIDVRILQPTENSLHLDNDVRLRAEMNAIGNMKYKLDNNTEVTACSNCSSFNVVLKDLANGQHTLKVTGLSGNKTDDATVNFRVNQTAEKPKEDNKTGEPRFSTGFQKLPQQFAAGEISEAELKNILQNNKLNPGILNRLARTGKLTPDLIDTIIETQFLPPGIAGKLLGILGFGKNKVVDTLVKHYNLTDEQLANLIQRSELPKGAVNRLIKDNKLGPIAINSLIENQELNPGAIKKLVESQTLTPGNVQRLIETQRLNKKIVATLIEQQLLDNATISQLKAFGNGEIEKQLEKFQQKEEKKGPKFKQDKDDDEEKPGKGKRASLGKQKKGRE